MPTPKDLEAARQAAERVNWAALDALDQDQIDTRAEADPENPPASGEELAQARRPDLASALPE